MRVKQWRPGIVVLVILLVLAGCSRVAILYGTADFFVKGYAGDYLDLDPEQIRRWEPQLTAVLARHRREELPYLAAFVEQGRAASRSGFDAKNTACLSTNLEALYRRQARLAVILLAPLLVDLTPSQIEGLALKFSAQLDEDRADLQDRNAVREERRRAERYVKAIEDWTGPLNASQREIVVDVTRRMPDNAADFIDYRTDKREQLIQRLRSGASEAEIQRFMMDWLVDFRDLPPALRSAGRESVARIEELFIRLGASFEPAQRDRLEERLRRLRDDLMKLQTEPRLTPLTCAAT